VEFNQQIYRAPSIPKLGRRNVSSSVLRSASKISAASPTPKLRVSRAKFTGRQEPIAEAVVSNAQALTETNLILVEIQKQLSLDFAMRIAEERETIKRMKAAESRRRFGAEEKAVEGTGKLGKGIGKVFNKVVSPAKSIFSKIIDFFSIILTGIVFNNAFKWLQDKNNREKVFAVIGWVTKHWKELLGVFIGVKVFGFLYKLIRFGRFISGFFGGRGGRGRGPGGRGPGGRGPGGLDPCGGVVKCIDKLKGPQLEALAEKLVKTKAFSDPKKSPVANALGGLGTALGVLGTIIDVVSLLLIFAPIPGSRLVAGALRALRLGKFAGIFTKFGRFAAGTKIPRIKIPAPARRPRVAPARTRRGVIPDDAEADALRRAAEADPALRRIAQEELPDKIIRLPMRDPTGGNPLERVRGVRGGRASKSGSTQVTQEQMRRFFGHGAGQAKEAANFNKGGIIPGPRVNKDVTPIMGTPGERVVPLSARGFFPFVDDIIFNGGKMWEMFSGAIKKLFLITRRQEETSRKFGEVTEKLDKSLKVEKQKAAIKSLSGGGGGSRASSFNVKPKASPTPSYYNLGRSAGGGMTFLPMVLPTKQSAPPTIPTPQAPATEVPFISPMNVADPYRQLTPEIYGIFV
jgi:hypothetical protein